MLIILLALASPGVAAAGPAFGKIDPEFIPGRWMAKLLPESGKEPAYAPYDKSDDLEKAKAQVWAGQYRRALITLQSLKKGNALEIALARAAAQSALGNKDQALATLSDAAVADQPRAIILKIQVLEELGRFGDGLALADGLVARQPDSIAGHYYQGHLRERLGDIAAAKQALDWFVDPKHDLLAQWRGHPSDFTSPADVTLLGRALDRWATLNSVYPQNRSLHDAVLGMFTRSYDVIDRTYWPAHIAAGEYFLAHDDPEQAAQDLQAALDANPQSIEALSLMGRIALLHFSFDGADQAIEAIRKVDDQSLEADLLEARNYLAQRRAKDALPALDRVLQKQPKSIEALGLLAAAQALLLHDDKTAEILKQADQINPHSAEAYFEVAEQLAAMRQYPRSAAMYQIAIGREPWWSRPRNGLGLLETQSGDEEAARAILETAHSLDPFNAATTNYLRLLDDMSKFARKETAHFIVIYDPGQDPVIPEYFSDYLESIYPLVTGAFEFEPKVKTIIEVFPTHAQFSVRTTGAPWIATVGASTGRIIALVSPRKGRQTMGTFNWSEVLRHEFTHTVTLGATDNRIAHWFTEGLAVQQEHAPLRWEWVPMLYYAVKNHQLFPLDQLTWGFVRPKRPSDRSLAYAQSWWICQYIEQTYGHPAILSLLDQFRLGHDQAEAFQTVLGKSESQFNQEFQTWCEKQVAGWGYDPVTSAKYTALRDQAEAMKKHGEFAQSARIFEQIVLLRPVDSLPHQRLAGLYLQLNQLDKAAAQLEYLAEVELKDNKYAKGLARIYGDEGKLDLAVKRATQAAFIDPYDADAHEILAALLQKTGNQAGVDREKRVIEVLRERANPPAAPTTAPATQPN